MDGTVHIAIVLYCHCKYRSNPHIPDIGIASFVVEESQLLYNCAHRSSNHRDMRGNIHAREVWIMEVLSQSIKPSICFAYDFLGSLAPLLVHGGLGLDIMWYLLSWK